MSIFSASMREEVKDGGIPQKPIHEYADRPLTNFSDISHLSMEGDTAPPMLCLQDSSSLKDEGLPQDCNGKETQVNVSIFSDEVTCPEAEYNNIELKEVNTHARTLDEYPCLTTAIRVKVEYSDNDTSSPSRYGMKEPHSAYNQSIGVHGFHVEPISDELDHIPLKERKRMLLSRQTMGTNGQLSTHFLEGTSLTLSSNLVGAADANFVGKVKEESNFADEQQLVARNDSHTIPDGNATANDSSSSLVGTSCAMPHCSPKTSIFEDNAASSFSDSCGVPDINFICSTETASTELKSSVAQKFMMASPDYMLGSALSASRVNVKVETLENGLESPCENPLDTCSKNSIPVVKQETGVYCESYDDELDHMPLRQRIMLLLSRKKSPLNDSRNFERFSKTVPSVLREKPTHSQNTKHEAVKCRKKRKKTATDSIETALEEDAPGLLQVLIDKGILVDEMKLYGGMESEEAIDSSFEEDSFDDLESVISKLFFERSSFLKFGPIRCVKAAKASYCLSCLISLVEQSRYLQFRKWPVEWGWCRDLQSFIFVFERHNRIVLERPEYGYATYFFELVNSLPVNWQIKRLITAMKLTSCSRATLLENKSLLVGKDLTEGEARVLEEYGWIPNLGLGSMLNYCDRVVHDKSNERNGAEWRLKIGKLLMNGYNGGTKVLTDLPKKVMGYMSTKDSSIKLEPFM